MLPERFLGGGVIFPDDVQVQDFLDRCQEAGRHVLEEKIAKLRSQAAASLELDIAKVDAVFASNRIDAPITTLQEKARLVNQQHQGWCRGIDVEFSASPKRGKFVTIYALDSDSGVVNYVHLTFTFEPLDDEEPHCGARGLDLQDYRGW